MIDELTRADPARDEEPTPAQAGRMDDRLHLLLQAETVARPRRRRRAWVAVPVAALATAAFTLGVTLPGGKTTAVLEPPPASAATVLADLQGKAAVAPTEQGRYAYLKRLSYTTHMRPGNVTEVVPHESEQWIADDGTGVYKEVIHWKEKPPFPVDESPHAIDDADVLGMSLEEVRTLPTDPARLRQHLEDRDNVIVTAYAGALLSFAGTPTDVKVALYSVLKSLPGAKLIPSETDPLKRTGVGVQFDDEAWRTLFLFDPATGELLGTRSIGKKEVPGRTITDWNLNLESGRTDTAPKTAR